MDPNYTIIDIDQHKEDAEVNNSLSEKRNHKDSQPGTGILTASKSYNAILDGHSEGHSKSYKDSFIEGPARSKDGTMNEKVEQSSLFEYRPAPFSTLEEYKTMMQEDIDSGRAGDRWFYEIDPEDKRIPIRSRSKLPETVSVGLNDIDYFNLHGDDVKGLGNIIVCLLLEDSTALMDVIEIHSYRWRVPNALRKAIQEHKSGSPVFVRLLMAQQINLDFGGASIRYETYKKNGPIRAQLCYVELIQGPCPDNLFDCVLNGEPVPRKLINVFHSGDGNNSNPEEKKHPALVVSCVISATGSHMATISIVESTAHLDWWELDLESSASPVKYPCPASTSTAHTFIGIIEKTSKPDFGLSLSWDGSQIALIGNNFTESATTKDSLRKSEQSAFRSYEPGQLMLSSKSQDQSQQLPLDLPISTRHRNCNELKDLKGEFKFTTSSKEKWDESTERLIASDGKMVMIYSTSGVWQRLHSIQLSSIVNPLNATISIRGASGGLFPWKESPYHLTLWSIESGRSVCDIRTQSMIDDCRVSFDGCAIAVLTIISTLYKGEIQVFSTKSGNFIHPSGLNGFSLEGYFSGAGGLLHLSTIPDGKNHFELNHSDARNLTCISSIQTQFHWYFGDDQAHRLSFQGIQKSGKCGSTVVAQRIGSIVSISYLSDFLAGSIDINDTVCHGDACPSKFQQIQAIGEQTALGLFRKSDLVPNADRDDISPSYISSMNWKKIWDFSSITKHTFFHLEKYNKLIAIGTGDEISSLLVWQLPTSSNQTIELLSFQCLNPFPSPSTIYCCPHGKELCISYDQTDMHISLITAAELKNGKPHISSIDALLSIIETHVEKQKVQLANIYLKYLGSIINNPPLDNIGMSIISRLCRCYVYNITFVKQIFGFVLQHGKPHSWIPLLKYSARSNPIGILLKYKRDQEISELVKILVEYCIDRAKITQDIAYIMFLCENMDQLAAQHPDLAIRATRAFAYLRCTDQDSVIKYAKPIQHPTFSSLWSRKEVSLDRCRNAILQVQSYESSQGSSAVYTFTEEIFVAPFSLLWTFILNARAGHQEYCRHDPMTTQSVIKNKFYLTRFHINPFRHVYIRKNNYDLTILDNPAIEALIQYKWNTIGFKFWLIRFVSQCIYYILIVAAAAIQVYKPKPELQLGVLIAIIIYSGIFLWLEFLQWKDHLKTSTSSKLTKKKKGTLRKVYKAIKAITKLLRILSAVLTGRSPSKDKDKENQETCVEGSLVKKEIEESLASEAKDTEVVMLENIDEEKNTGDSQEQELARAQEVEEKEISDQKDEQEDEEDDDEEDIQDGSNAKRSGPLFLRSQYDLLDFFMYFMTFWTGVHHIIVNGEDNRHAWDLSFCIIFVFLHMLSELRVSEIVCKYVTIVFDILNEIKVFLMVLAVGILFFSLAILHAVWAPGVKAIDGGFTNEYYGAITTLIFIMGGRYDSLSKNLMGENGEYLNWPLQVLLLTYFFFAVIVMLNVLIALVNAAYSRGDNNWRQVWLENRLLTIVRAENPTYHIPGYRASRDIFPDRIFYTATPYQVKQYWRRIKIVDEEVTFDSDGKEEVLGLSPDTSASADSPPASSSSSIVKEGTSYDDPDPSGFKQGLTRAMSGIEQGHIRDRLENTQKTQTPQDQMEDMTRLNNGMTGLKVEVKDLKGEVMDIKRGLTGLHDEIADMKAILTALVNLQQSQVKTV